MSAAVATSESALASANNKSQEAGHKSSGRGPRPKADAAGNSRPAGQRNPNFKPNPVFEAKRNEYERAMSTADAAVQKCRQRLNAIMEEFNASKQGNSPANSEKSEIRTQLGAIKAQRDLLISEKRNIMKSVEDTREVFKRKQAEIAEAKEKLPYKRIDEIDKKIKEMELSLESGNSKLIEEKRMIAEISKMKKTRRVLEGMEGQQSELDRLKKVMDDAKAASKSKDETLDGLKEQMSQLMDKLNALDADRGQVQAKYDTLSAERDKLRKEMDGHYQTKRKAFEDFEKAKEENRKWVEAEKIKREETRRRREIEDTIRHLEDEMRKLDDPPCADEITQASNIQTYLRLNVLKDTNAGMTTGSKTDNTLASSMASKLSIRQVDGISSDTVPLKTKAQKDEDGESYYFAPRSGKAAKQAKKQQQQQESHASDAAATIKMPFWIMSGLADLGLDTPATLSEIQTLVNEKLESVKKSYEEKAAEALRSVDSKRAVLKEKIEAARARLDAEPSKPESKTSSEATVSDAVSEAASSSPASTEAA